MGLDITALTYSGDKTWAEKFGSYGELHKLRDWVFVELLGKDKIESKYEPNGPTYYDGEYGDYEALLNHSDADGYYLSFKEFKITDVEDKAWCGDLDKLRKEIRVLKKERPTMPEHVQYTYDRLVEVLDTKDEWGETTCSILVFH